MKLDVDDPRPTYVQLADLLRHGIAAGEYPDGTKVPSVRAFAAEHQVAPATAAKAIDVLRREGLIVSRPGHGTLVRNSKDARIPTVQDQLDDLRRRVAALERRRAST